ncbi:MFS transporter [Falsiroseomonas oryziterrae]|uniref:MFS transporter n=1 Tax=Falsiroseomonas oryziterrae TaxID=2911368 RepID=UPI001F014769|nr:MFS transporter [Roseomonas sp. NPKOSM-4]
MDAAARQIAFVNIAHVFTHYGLLILATAVLAMVVQDGATFGTVYGPILALGTGMFVIYGLGSLPQGWIAERVGRPALLLAFFLGTGTGMVAAGLAPGPWTLAAGMFVYGAFSAIYHPIGTAMLVDAAGERVGAAVGVNGVFGNLGVALAPVVTAAIAAGMGWRFAFIVPGVLCIAAGIAYWRNGLTDVARAKAASKPFPAIPPAIVRRAVISLLAIATASGFVFNGFTLLIPKLMEERLANSPDLLPVVGALAFLVTICGGLTQFTVGRLIDRHTLKRVFMPLALVQMPALLVLTQLAGWPVLVVAGLVCASVFGVVTVNETMTARYVAPALRAKLYSIRFSVGFLGAALASPVVGLLHEATGAVTAVLVVLAAFSAITLICALFFPNREEELKPELWTKAAPAPAE